jgi:hypothetical protein
VVKFGSRAAHPVRIRALADMELSGGGGVVPVAVQNEYIPILSPLFPFLVLNVPQIETLWKSNVVFDFRFDHFVGTLYANFFFGRQFKSILNCHILVNL